MKHEKQDIILSIDLAIEEINKTPALAPNKHIIYLGYAELLEECKNEITALRINHPQTKNINNDKE